MNVIEAEKGLGGFANLHRNNMSLDFVGIEGMQRLAGLDQNIIGDVDDIVYRMKT